MEKTNGEQEESSKQPCSLPAPARAPAGVASQRQSQTSTPKVVIYLVKAMPNQSPSSESVNRNVTDRRLTTTQTLPSQSLSTGKLKQPQFITVLKVARNTQSGAIALSKPPKTNAIAEGDLSEGAVCKETPKAGTTSVQSIAAENIMPGDSPCTPSAVNATFESATNASADHPPPPYSASTSVLDSVPENFPSIWSQTHTTSTRVSNERFLVGSYISISKTRREQHWTYSNEVPRWVVGAVVLLLCTFIFLTPLSLLCTIPFLCYTSMVCTFARYNYYNLDNKRLTIKPLAYKTLKTS